MNMDGKDLFRDKNIVWLVVLGLIILLLLAGSVLSVLGISQLSQLAQSEEDSLKQGQERVVYLTQLAADEEKTRETAEEYRAMLPEKVRQDEMFSRIQSLGNEYNITISQISFFEAQLRGASQYLPISLTLSGGYSKIMEMLDAFCYEDRLVAIDTITIDKKGGLVGVTAHLAIFFDDPSLIPPPAPAEATGETDPAA